MDADGGIEIGFACAGLDGDAGEPEGGAVVTGRGVARAQRQELEGIVAVRA